MNYRHFRYEGWLYGLAFLLALAVRFVALDAMPLNDTEATSALQALQLSQGLKPVLGPHPAYILLTTPLFFLYGGGTDVLARAIPALAGSVLVFAPLLFANRIKPRPTLVLAFFIALDPGLTAISRQVGSPILAVTFLVFALGYLNQKKLPVAGMFAGLALLGGPAIWPGILGIAITWGIYQVVRSRLDSKERSRPQVGKVVHMDYKDALTPLAITFVGVGSLFFIVPNGLSAALGSISSYLVGWVTASSINMAWMLISLLAYQPLAVFLSAFTMVRGWRNASLRVIPLSVWLFVSLLIALFYPARQVTDLAWALLPLWTLSALGIVRFMDIQLEERKEALGAILLAAFLWIFAWLNFSGLVWMAPEQAGYSLRLWMVIGSLILLVVSLLLIAFGWSIRVAQFGAIWGLGLGLGILGLAGTLGSTGMHGLSRPELWWPQGVPQQAQLLETTVDDLSEWGMGYDNAIQVILYRLYSPSLEWTLREHDPVVADVLDIASAPELVVTDFAGDPDLAASYRGQDFAWKQVTSWEIAQPRDWLRWLAYREMIQTNETIILWAREDLFLDSSLEPAQ
jgi:hypothetical protein